MVNNFKGRFSNIPHYPDDSDYTTNAPSYYDDLARKQKLIQLLAERIWEYENTLNESLEQIEKRLTDYITDNDNLMNERLENWDKRIEDMPEEMRSLFVEWLNDGTLEQIINHDVLGNKADQSDLDETNAQLAQIVLNLNDFERLPGEEDDTERLKRALIEAETSRMELFIPVGITLEFSETLVLKNRVSIRGQNKMWSILRYTGNGKAFELKDPDNPETTYGQGSEFNNLTNLRIIGPGAETDAIAISGEPRYNVFDNIYIEHFGRIFDVDNNWTNKYTNCMFRWFGTFYRSNNQNNAVHFTNCFMYSGKVGFDMLTAYNVSFINGNIEGLTESILLPRRNGARFSNFTISNCYLENTAPLFNSLNPASNGTTITSWNLWNFVLENSQVNHFRSSERFINQTLPILDGTIRNNVFYKQDDSELFNLSSSPVLFEQNQYRYFGGDSPQNLTKPFSDSMLNFNTNYSHKLLGGNNTVDYSGMVRGRKGLRFGNEVITNTNKPDGYAVHSVNLKTLRLWTDNKDEYVQMMFSGPSTSRTEFTKPMGYMMFDTTLGKPIWWNGTNWVDSNGVNS